MIGPQEAMIVEKPNFDKQQQELDDKQVQELEFERELFSDYLALKHFFS